MCVSVFSGRNQFCLISFLYLHLCGLGDDALIRKGPFMRIFLLTVTRRGFFCGSFMLFLSYFCYAFMRVCLLMPCGHLAAGKGLTSWLSSLMSNCEVDTCPLVSWVRCGA